MELGLSNGQTALVDDADFPLVSRWKWKAHGRGYVYRHTRQGKLYLHRLLMGAEKGQEVDHINRNPLDNRRENMRIVAHWINAHNRQSRPTTGERGVRQPKGRNRWNAYIYVNGTYLWLGSHMTKELAVAARNKAEVAHGLR